MNRFKIIEELIEKETGRIVDGKAVWNEIEYAAGQYPEDGMILLTGTDNTKEKWEYSIELKRTYDEEYDQWETEITLLEIIITDKKTQKTEHIKVQGATL